MSHRSVDVWWLSLNEGTPERGYWDQTILEALFDGRMWDIGIGFEHHVGRDDRPSGGAVVVLPARSQVEHVAAINDVLAELPWVLLIVCGDEEHSFPWREITHPRMRVWVQTPDPQLDLGADGFLPVGWTPLTDVMSVIPDKDFAWMFAGQNTHPRRWSCVDALERLGDSIGPSVLLKSESFTAGFEQHAYLATMARALVAPCPSGPVTVDTFRVWEALELGAIPIVDGRTPKRDESSYWSLLFDEPVPFPVIDDWSTVGPVISTILNDWSRQQTIVRAWWTRAKRSIAERFARQLRDLASIPDTADDRITVVMTCSPIPSHPFSTIIDETIESVRAHLPRATIVLACDGVRPEQEHLRGAYEQWLWEAATYADRNVVVDPPTEWLHQANTTKRSMRLVSTAALLFIEHDTPLLDRPIPWEAIIDVVHSGAAQVVRFAHEASVHPEHRWLMIDLEPRDLGGVPVQQTMQWSQRPHVADTGWYAAMLYDYFGAASRTMIEDTMHGVLQVAWDVDGHASGDQWRVFLFTPDGDIKRSTHTDGREQEAKWDMIYEYDGTIPTGAPHPTSQRKDG